MSSSKTLEIFHSSGPMPGGQAVEVFDTDDDGDVCLLVWEKGKSTAELWMTPERARSLAINLLKAADR